MARLRSNFQTGSLGASLTNNGGTITFAVAPNFATIVAPDYIPITLEPNPVGAAPGNAEVVWLTAYTAAATTGTIVRGKEGTAGVAHNNGVAWVHGPTVWDMPPVDPNVSGSLTGADIGAARMVSAAMSRG